MASGVSGQLSREEKEALADRKMEEMKKKNELLMKKFLIAEEDKKRAEVEGRYFKTIRTTRSPSPFARRLHYNIAKSNYRKSNAEHSNHEEIFVTTIETKESTEMSGAKSNNQSPRKKYNNYRPSYDKLNQKPPYGGSGDNKMNYQQFNKSAAQDLQNWNKHGKINQGYWRKQDGDKNIISDIDMLRQKQFKLQENQPKEENIHRDQDKLQQETDRLKQQEERVKHHKNEDGTWKREWDKEKIIDQNLKPVGGDFIQKPQSTDREYTNKNYNKNQKYQAKYNNQNANQNFNKFKQNKESLNNFNKTNDKRMEQIEDKISNNNINFDIANISHKNISKSPEATFESKYEVTRIYNSNKNNDKKMEVNALNNNLNFNIANINPKSLSKSPESKFENKYEVTRIYKEIPSSIITSTEEVEKLIDSVPSTNLNIYSNNNQLEATDLNTNMSDPIDNIDINSKLTENDFNKDRSLIDGDRVLSAKCNKNVILNNNSEPNLNLDNISTFNLHNNNEINSFSDNSALLFSKNINVPNFASSLNQDVADLNKNSSLNENTLLTGQNYNSLKTKDIPAPTKRRGQIGSGRFYTGASQNTSTKAVIKSSRNNDRQVKESDDSLVIIVTNDSQHIDAKFVPKYISPHTDSKNRLSHHSHNLHQFASASDTSLFNSSKHNNLKRYSPRRPHSHNSNHQAIGNLQVTDQIIQFDPKLINDVITAQIETSDDGTQSLSDVLTDSLSSRSNALYAKFDEENEWEDIDDDDDMCLLLQQRNNDDLLNISTESFDQFIKDNTLSLDAAVAKMMQQHSQLDLNKDEYNAASSTGIVNQIERNSYKSFLGWGTGAEVASLAIEPVEIQAPQLNQITILEPHEVIAITNELNHSQDQSKGIPTKELQNIDSEPNRKVSPIPQPSTLTDMPKCVITPFSNEHPPLNHISAPIQETSQFHQQFIQQTYLQQPQYDLNSSNNIQQQPVKDEAKIFTMTQNTFPQLQDENYINIALEARTSSPIEKSDNILLNLSSNDDAKDKNFNLMNETTEEKFVPQNNLLIATEKVVDTNMAKDDDVYSKIVNDENDKIKQ